MPATPDTGCNIGYRNQMPRPMKSTPKATEIRLRRADKGDGKPESPNETHEKSPRLGKNKPARTQADHNGDGHEEEGDESG